MRGPPWLESSPWSAPQVKPTRRISKPARPFGEGIFTRREPDTAADLAWAAQNLNADATDYDVLDSDALAGEAEAQVRLEAGCFFWSSRGLGTDPWPVSLPVYDIVGYRHHETAMTSTPHTNRKPRPAATCRLTVTIRGAAYTARPIRPEMSEVARA
jgi:hypothetical protein